MMKKQENKRRRALFSLTLSAMLCALSIVILYLGTLLDVVTLTAVALASLLMMLAVRELSIGYRLMIYVGATLLAALLLPNPEAAILYAMLGGLYPLIKLPIERLRRPLPVVLKLVYTNLLITASELLSLFVFALTPSAWYILLPLYLIGNPTFLLYDKVLDRLLIYYEARLRPRLARYI